MNAVIQKFLSWRMLVVLLMGFSSGVPLGLTGPTLQVWMEKCGVDIATIGIFAIVGLPYTLKFLWSPLLDRFVPPLLGRRRGWMLVGQLGVTASLVAMAFCNPGQHLLIMGILALLVAGFSATQDIAVDAYRTEILLPDELGPGSSLYIMGYRIAMVFSGSVAFVLANYLDWPTVYLIMAGTMLIGVATSLLSPEPKLNVRAPQTLYQAVVLPFAEFICRPGWVWILVFILIYKLDVAMATGMSAVFIKKVGFGDLALGINSGIGVVATIVGAMIGGAATVRIGIRRSLWCFGLLQGISGMCFSLLAVVGMSYWLLTVCIIAENTCVGMATAAFTGFIMSQCDKRYTATQYALLTSLMALGRVAISVPSGWIQTKVGWPMFFVITMLVAIPGLLMLLRYNTWTARKPELVTELAD